MLHLSHFLSLILSLVFSPLPIQNKHQQQQPEIEKAATKPASPPPASPAAEYPGSVTLTAASGASASFVPGGAALQRLLVPDAEGRLDDIALGWDDPKRYEV